MKKFICLMLSGFVIVSAAICGFKYLHSNCTEESGIINCSFSGADDEYEGLFQSDNIVDINVNISEEDFNKMLDNPLSNDYYNVSVNIDDDTVNNVGICTKGNLTLKSVAKSDSKRYSFGFQFDEYVDGQTYKGIKSFCVNNNYADPSYLREYLSYEMLKSIGAKTPLCTIARVSINGEYYGLYTMVERVDEKFIERVFNTTEELNHYEANRGSSLATEESLKNISLVSGDDENLDKLKTLVNFLNNINEENYKQIEEFLDVDSVLQYIAANLACGNYDSYLSGQAQNYEFIEYDGKLYMIPWDFNMAFGGFQGGNISIDIDNPSLNSDSSKLPLLKLLEFDEYKDKYYGYLEQCVEYLEGIESRIGTLADEIREDVYNDPTKFYTNEDFESELVYKESSSTKISNIPDKADNMKADKATQNNGMNIMPPPEDNNMNMGDARMGMDNNGIHRRKPHDNTPQDNAVFNDLAHNNERYDNNQEIKNKGFQKPRVTLMTYASNVLSSLKTQLNS